MPLQSSPAHASAPRAQHHSSNGNRLTARQRREREYYEQYSRLHAPAEIDFAPILGPETRPWNPYWFTYQLVRELCTGESPVLLDMGCGPGVDCVRYARIGYDVLGIDVSPGNIAVARQLAARHDVAERVTVQPMVCERLAFRDESFDVVTGVDILHHVEIGDAVAESLRVLRPGGTAIFKEWIEAPLFDQVRRLAVVRRLFPTDVSLDNHITEDERKLNAGDLAIIRGLCPDVDVHRFGILSRMDRFWPPKESNVSWLERIDQRLMQLCPPFGRLGGAVVIVLRKPG
ncbi:MAG TPA: class I SAM-dependent methyltransferase [Gemmatimonadaceae bacterium]|nr:class I SAM-dependent methyltransferase [Gemmatimonadaceae bacterium]